MTHVRKGAAAKLHRRDVAKLHESARALVAESEVTPAPTRTRKRTKKVVKNGS